MRLLTRIPRGGGGLWARADGAVRYLWLNVLWTAVSLTLIGAPAATVAMHAVVEDWAAKNERPVARQFFGAIRVHGIRATAWGAALAFISALVVVNALIALRMGAQAPYVLGILGAVALSTALISTALPASLAARSAGAVGTLRDAVRRVAGRPLHAAATIVAVVALAVAALAFPPALLLLPAPLARLLLLRHGGRMRVTLPRTRIERTYA